MSDRQYPSIEDLSKKDQDTIRRIVSGEDKVTSVSVDEYFTDDHELCADITINDVKVSIWWDQRITAFEYCDESAKALTKVKECLQSQLEVFVEQYEGEEE